MGVRLRREGLSAGANKYDGLLPSYLIAQNARLF